jgi:hypothetical protein
LLFCYRASPPAITDIEEVSAEHVRLAERARRFSTARDGMEIFAVSGFVDLDSVSLLPVATFNQQLVECA